MVGRWLDWIILEVFSNLGDSVILFISMETTTATKSTVNMLDKGNSELQNTISLHSHCHWLCIFSTNEQGLAGLSFSSLNNVFYGFVALSHVLENELK